MTFETQIVLRHDDPDQLAEDVRAVAEFIEKRKHDQPMESRERQKSRPRTHLGLVGAAHFDAR